VLPEAKGITTLIYHRIDGGTDSSVDISLATFEQHMEWLRTNCRVVPLQLAVDAVRVGDSSINGAVVVTFDDGTSDFCENAVPVLVRHGIPVTLFAETGPISTGSPNAGGLMPVSWGALRDAASTGLVAIESHTHTHRVLRKATRAVTIDELDRSIDAISAEIGVPPRHFAYPKAERGSPSSRAEVAKRFESAAVGGGRPMKTGGDLQTWLRTPVQTSDSFEVFQRKVKGGMLLEGIARSSVSRWRYRRAVR
jgi:peptidoglycan/xylan/chitin deacetylase (PgdA/CDA1 family)